MPVLYFIQYANKDLMSTLVNNIWYDDIKSLIDSYVLWGKV